MLNVEGSANVENRGPQALDQVRDATRKQQDGVAAQRHEWIESNRYFYDPLEVPVALPRRTGQASSTSPLPDRPSARCGETKLWRRR
jgi:hypothetical protein